MTSYGGFLGASTLWGYIGGNGAPPEMRGSLGTMLKTSAMGALNKALGLKKGNL